MQPLAITAGQREGSSQKLPQPTAFPLKLPKFLLLFLALGVGFLLGSMDMTRFFGMESFVSADWFRFWRRIDEHDTLRGWIRPPVSLMHEMTDEELFWRASFVPQVKKYPFNRVPKIAFLFLTRGPLPLHPLWEMFLTGHEGFYSIYIHSPPSYRPEFPPASPFYGRQVPSQVSEWGQMSMCDAERRLLANALLDISNEWFVLLSESCIPLLNFSITYEYLMRSQYSYVGAYDVPGPGGRGRYDLNMAPEVNITQWRKASQWFEVSRRVAVTVVKDVKFYPKFKEVCSGRRYCYADEHYLPTMLTIELPYLLANRTITWVDWSRRGPHPATFGMADVTEAFLRGILKKNNCMYNNQSSAVCFLFGRKFSPNTLQPLLRLGPKVLGFS